MCEVCPGCICNEQIEIKMNKDRRKQLQDCIAKLDEVQNEVDCLKDDEQEYYDNMPEGLQQGEKGQKSEECCSALDEAVSDIQSAIENISEAIE